MTEGTAVIGSVFPPGNVNNSMRAMDGESLDSEATLLEYLDVIPARTLLDRLHLPVLAVGPGGDILYVNAAFAEMVGTPSGLEGRQVSSLFASSDDGQPNGATVLRDMAGRITTWRHRDGYEVYAAVSRPLTDGRGGEELLLVLDDVTESEWLHGM